MKILLQNGLIINKIQNLLIENNFISYVGEQMPTADKTIDLKGALVLPGFIDPHVHLRDMEQAYKEDWQSGSQAALQSGVTTVFDMPNNIPPIISLENLNLKRKKAENSAVNYKFYMAANQHNAHEIEKAFDEKPNDMAGIKLFLAGSSSNEVVSQEEDLLKIFELSKKYNIPLAVHSEKQCCLDETAKQITEPNVLKHNQIRHRNCSVDGTKQILKLAEKVGNKLYIVHTSTAEEIELIKEYKKRCAVYCEVSPHHLLLDESITEKVGNFAKVNPPIRTKADNIAIMRAIVDGTVDTIGTDHAPHAIYEKQRDYLQAPSGFPGLETYLPLLLNEVYKGSFTIEKLIEITSTNAAKIFDFGKRGKLETGYIADLVVVDQNAKFNIEAKNFVSKAKYSPFEGMEARGKVLLTFIDGEIKYSTILL